MDSKERSKRAVVDLSGASEMIVKLSQDQYIRVRKVAKAELEAMSQGSVTLKISEDEYIHIEKVDQGRLELRDKQADIGVQC